MGIVFAVIGTVVYYSFFRLRSLSEPDSTLEESVAAAESSGEAIRLTFAQLRQWRYSYPEKRPPAPEKFDLIKDKEIMIRGYMFVTNNAGRVDKFQFSQFCYGCCFRGAPAINEFVEITVPPEQGGVQYNPAEALWINGTLEWGEKLEGGFATSIYRIKADYIGLGQKHKKGDYSNAAKRMGRGY